MLISGFTILRNGVEFDFPFLESLQSILPVCDEFIINLGESTDDTEIKLKEFIQKLPDPNKVKIIKTKWPLDDAEKRKDGQILSEQTNIALNRCKGEWCFYLQADEVLHERDHPKIIQCAKQMINKNHVEAFVFEYIHFYGGYDVVQTSRSSYRREIRMIRNGIGIQSVGDAQSFRHADGRKLNGCLIDAKIYHYGWVRPQEIMKAKTGFMDTLYHPNADIHVPTTGCNYLYKNIVGLRPFNGEHPRFMQTRVQQAARFDFSKAPRVFHIKDTWKLLSGWIESFTGHRLFEFKNYILVERNKK